MAKLICIIAISIASSLALLSSPLTIEEAISEAKANSHSLKLRQGQLRQAEAKLGQASNSKLGDLELQAGYTRLSDVPEFVFNFTDILPPSALAEMFSPEVLAELSNTEPQPIIPVILNNYTFQLSATQPLFTGFALSSAEEAMEISLEAQKANLEREEESVEVQAAEAYWTLYKLIRMKEVAEATVSQLEKNAENIKNLRDAGMATESDLLKMQVAVSEAKMMVIEAGNGIMMSSVRLNTLLGRPVTETVEPISSPEGTTAAPLNLPPLEDVIDSRKDIKASRLMVDAAEKSIEISEAAYWPSLALGGNFYYNNPNQRIQPLTADFNETWDVGIYLQYNLTDIWKNDYKVQEAEAGRMLAAEQLAMQKDMVAIELSQAYLELRKQIEKLETIQVSVEQAKESRRMTENQYKAGLAIASDLIEAENSLLRSEINYNNTIADIQIAKAKLDYVIGR